jgi:histone deacetylase 1/2
MRQVPLDNGTDDATFHRLFKPIMEKVVQVFQPGAVVLQCGAQWPGRHKP